MAALSALIVDDDRTILTMLTKTFEDAGFTVRAAEDGGRAAALIRSEEFDVVVLDINLPAMNGLQVASIARSGKVNRKAEIFVISGRLDADAVKRAAEIGVANILSKPFDAKALVEKAKAKVQKAGTQLKYDVQIINCFVGAAAEVLTFYLGSAPQIGRPTVRPPGGSPGGEVTGLIAFSGQTYIGSLAFNLGVDFVKRLAAKVFDGGEVVLDDALMGDLTGEMCNQLLGKVKLNFGKLGIPMRIGLPEVVLGKGHRILHKVHNPVLSLPLTLDGLSSHLEFCMDQSVTKEVDAKPEAPAVTGALIFE